MLRGKNVTTKMLLHLITQHEDINMDVHEILHCEERMRIQKLQILLSLKDGSHNWGGFAHIESLVVHCLGAHFMNIWDPSFGKMQNDI